MTDLEIAFAPTAEEIVVVMRTTGDSAHGGEALTVSLTAEAEATRPALACLSPRRQERTVPIGTVQQFATR